MSGGFSHGPSAVASTTNGQLLGNAASSAAAAGAGSPSFSTRISDFVERNKQALLIAAGAGAVVVGGAAGYYYYSRPAPASSRLGKGKKEEGTDDDELSAPGAAGKSGAGSKKKKKKSRKTTGPSTASGATATSGNVANEASSPTVSEGGESEIDGEAIVEPDCAVHISDQLVDPLRLTSSQLAALPIEVCQFATDAAKHPRG